MSLSDIQVMVILALVMANAILFVEKKLPFPETVPATCSDQSTEMLGGTWAP